MRRVVTAVLIVLWAPLSVIIGRVVFGQQDIHRPDDVALLSVAFSFTFWGMGTLWLLRRRIRMC